jgi:hypothetical protein
MVDLESKIKKVHNNIDTENLLVGPKTIRRVEVLDTPDALSMERFTVRCSVEIEVT